MGLTRIDSNNFFQQDVIGNVRQAQEDSNDFAILTPNGDVFVVCDGMGGHVGGKQASSIAVKSIIEHLKKEKYPNPEEALNEALHFANMQILGYANEHPELKGMGTTACIVLLQDQKAYIAHVGDSRIYLYLGKEKQLHRITKDHSYVQTLVDAGEITDEEAESHPQKNRILKALGIRPQLSPTINQVSPKNGDIFMICSDGLSGMINDTIIEGVLEQDTLIKTKGEALMELALSAGGLDNITLQLIKITNSPYAISEFTSYNPKSKEGTSQKIIIEDQQQQQQIKEDTTKKKSSKLNIVKILSYLLMLIAIGAGAYMVYDYMTYKPEVEVIKKDNNTIADLKADFDKYYSIYDSLLLENNYFKEYTNDTAFCELVKKIDNKILTFASLFDPLSNEKKNKTERDSIAQELAELEGYINNELKGRIAAKEKAKKVSEAPSKEKDNKENNK